MALRLEAVAPSRSLLQLNRSLDFRRTYHRSRDWRRCRDTQHRHQAHSSDFSSSQRRHRLRVAAGFNSEGSRSMSMSSSGSQPFMTLGLQPAAGLKDIKSAYRTLAIQYHPDLNSSPDATEKFLEIREAYEAALSSVKTHPHHSTRPSQSRSQKKHKSRGRDELDDIFGDWV